MLKSTLTTCALAALLGFVPAQSGETSPDAHRAELEDLQRELEELRTQEEALVRRIAELRGARADVEKRADAERRLRRMGRPGGAPPVPPPPPREEPFDGRGTADPFADPFARHREMMDEMRRRMEEAWGGRHNGSPFGGFDFEVLPGRSSGQSMSVEAGPDGVRATVKDRGADGKWTTKVYEGESMDELRKKYPDVFGKTGAGGFRLDFDPDLRPEGGRPGGGSLSPFDDFGAPARPLGPRLGVHVSESDEGGLDVSAVESGSLADKLGIQKGDLIVEVNGLDIGSAFDVAAALLRGGATAKVVVRRDGEEKTLSAETGAPPRERSLRRRGRDG